MTNPVFTQEELQMYAAYEDVRLFTEFSMFSPEARELSGLSKKDYEFVMSNLSALRRQYEAEEDAAILNKGFEGGF